MKLNKPVEQIIKEMHENDHARNFFKEHISEYGFNLEDTETEQSPKGLYLSIEGMEGVGKSTVVEYLSKQLMDDGLDVLYVHEPGNTPQGEDIRDILLNKPYSSDLEVYTQLLLYTASRIELYNKVIKPALDQGKVVISDRTVVSSLVYQGFKFGISTEVVLSVNKPIIDNMANHTFILDLSVEEAKKRVQQRDDSGEQSMNFLDKLDSQDYLDLKNGYLKVQEYLPNISVIDVQEGSINASKTIYEAIKDDIKRIESHQ